MATPEVDRPRIDLEPEQTVEREELELPRNRRRWIWWVVGGGGIAALLLILFILFLVTRKSQEPQITALDEQNAAELHTGASLEGAVSGLKEMADNLASAFSTRRESIVSGVAAHWRALDNIEAAGRAILDTVTRERAEFQKGISQPPPQRAVDRPSDTPLGQAAPEDDLSRAFEIVRDVPHDVKRLRGDGNLDGLRGEVRRQGEELSNAFTRLLALEELLEGLKEGQGAILGELEGIKEEQAEARKWREGADERFQKIEERLPSKHEHKKPIDTCPEGS